MTGLTVVDTATDLSLFGQAVVLGLIPLGGLGIMIFGTLFVVLGRRALGVRQAKGMSEMVSQERLGVISRTLKLIVAGTLAIEAVGAVLLFPLWRTHDLALKAIFHSVSAFCNAGLRSRATT